MEKVSIAYHEHKGTVIDKGKFEHIMALALNPLNHEEGLVRCIVKRKGVAGIKGFRDKSVLYTVKSIRGLERYKLRRLLEIKDQEKVVSRLLKKNQEFIGLEDPDIYWDSNTKLYHVYFTIPLIGIGEHPSDIHLGHAEGKDLDSLQMTLPVVSPKEVDEGGAKELSLAPVNKDGVRLNLVESSDRIGKVGYSTIAVAISHDYGPPWEFGEVVFHPKYNGYKWCEGHASPGPLLPRSFIDVGKTRRVGILNARSATQFLKNKTQYGPFTIGLMIYDFQKGKIEWVSKETMINDSKATNITFASQFIQKDKEAGVLYAHVDDSFVRAYTLYADGIRELVKKYS